MVIQSQRILESDLKQFLVLEQWMEKLWQIVFFCSVKGFLVKWPLSKALNLFLFIFSHRPWIRLDELYCFISLEMF